MVILDLTVNALGRFQLNDDGSITEVLFNPWTTEEEVALLTSTVKEKMSPFNPRREALLAAIASLYDLGPDDVTIHSDSEPPPAFEPSPEPEVSS